MSTTRVDIECWLKEAESEGATHLIVVCDTFDHEDYPVRVMPGEDVRKRADEYNRKSMQRVMEVYSLTGKYPIETQLKESQAFHYD